MVRVVLQASIIVNKVDADDFPVASYGLHLHRAGIKKSPALACEGLFYLKPGGVLLSHGETPHYHRR